MIDLLRKRRSIRSYTSEPIDQQSLDILIEALLRSPSSRNINPWEFIVVDEPLLLARLAAVREHGSSFLKQAPLGIVVCADSTKSDVWVEDCSIAAILLQMTALSLGLGSCWIQIRNRRHDATSTAEAYVRSLLGLPEKIAVEAIIALGHPAEEREPLPAEALEYAKVKHHHYARPWRKAPR